MNVLAAEGEVSPGVLGFLIVAALGATLFVLIRSMNKQISRIEAPSEEDLKQAEWERRQRGADAMPNDAGPNDAMPNGAGPNGAGPDGAKRDDTDGP